MREAPHDVRHLATHLQERQSAESNLELPGMELPTKVRAPGPPLLRMFSHGAIPAAGHIANDTIEETGTWEDQIGRAHV